MANTIPDPRGSSVLPIPKYSYPPASLGPFGGQTGDSWNDGTYTSIRQIEIATGDYVDSIRVEYDDYGRAVWSEKHGGNGGKEQLVTLNYPEEFIISISGYIDKTTHYVRSLTFQTNTRKLGPFGPEDGEFFSSPNYDGKIVGFYGRSGFYIDSIGAYVIPNPTFLYPPKVVGPFGGQTGNVWDDGVYTTVRQIEIAAGDYVDSIHIQYDKGGRAVWSEKHGGDGGKKSLVTLNYPEEFIISISGYIDKDTRYVRSLTFQTNTRELGPFGPEVGEFFSSPEYDGRTIGFYGRSGLYIDSIGAYMVPNPTFSNSPKVVGPFGGQSGNSWDDGVYTTIRQIEIATGDYVDSIRVEYDKGGRAIWSNKHGGEGGNKSVVTLKYPDEFIISISGYINTGSGRYVRSLTFETNMRKLGPFGPENGEFFSFPEYNGQVVGFYGRSGWYIDSIGAYMVPIPAYVFPPTSLGPFGGKSGDSWDDGVYTAIRQIEIATGDYVDSIRVQYDKAGRAIWSQKHGGDGGKKSLVTLNYPGEFLISISGYIDKDTRYVRSLTFETNMRKLGPFGPEQGQFFSTPEYEGSIVGFFGRSGLYIDSVGAYMEPIWG